MKALVLAVLLCPAICFSQHKVEKETRMKEKDVPSNATEFVNNLDFGSKVKWYHEESLNHSTIEAKTKYEKRHYSIEFDTTGNILDIEMTVAWEELPSPVKNSVDSCLTHNFDSYKIKKIQKQYSGDDDKLVHFKTNDHEHILTIKYEIVISGKEGRDIRWYECTFDHEGLWEQSRKIIFSNSDNLEF